MPKPTKPAAKKAVKKPAKKLGSYSTLKEAGISRLNAYQKLWIIQLYIEGKPAPSKKVVLKIVESLFNDFDKILRIFIKPMRICPRGDSPKP